MDGGRTELEDHPSMPRRAVAFMAFESVAGIDPRLLYHMSVPHHLCDDRRGAYDGYLLVAPYDGLLQDEFLRSLKRSVQKDLRPGGI